MPSDPAIDQALVTWGDRLFYPGNRIVKSRPAPRLMGKGLQQRADHIRGRIRATVVRRAPQVMVKVTGGGRGMKAIAAHFRYISKNGRLEIEDQRGEAIHGREGLRGLADEWRFGGSLIPEDAEYGHRREAFNIMLSMPRGTDPLAVQRAARAFARAELAGHKYVMVLHDHQANPHVHLSVRAESAQGRRLNPRKTDLHRWRETFAEQLHEQGIDAEATRQATRGARRQPAALWQIKAAEAQRLAFPRPGQRTGAAANANRAAARDAWQALAAALAGSAQASDQRLGAAIRDHAQSLARAPQPTRDRQDAMLGPTPRNPDRAR